MQIINIKPICFKPIFLAAIICLFCFGAMGQTQTAAKKPAAKPAVAKPAAAPKTVAAILDTFFKKYKEGGPDSAITYLFNTNKLLASLPQVSLLKSKLDSLQFAAGKFLGKELISQKSASLSLVYYSYLVKYENQPFRFTFMFYKPQNEWELYRFKYDDQMDAELEEAGRINNKHP